MTVESIRNALASLPEVEEAKSEDDVHDLYSLTAGLTQVLRKMGVEQMRGSRELLNALEPLGEAAEVHAAWQREQERATESERQLARLAGVLIGALDSIARFASLLREAEGLEEWAVQLDKAVDVCHRDGEKAGLVPLADRGDRFDEAAHDTVSEAPAGTAPVIARVVMQGYALNGRVLRRATVEVGG